MKDAARVLFLLVLALSLAQLMLAAQRLPLEVPLHFNAAGQPDSWGSRASLLILNSVLLAMNATLFLGLPWLTKRLPDDLINIPQKEYWLDPVRRDESLRAMGEHLLWMGTATQLLLMDLLAQTVQVATGVRAQLGHSGWSLGLYLGFTGLWVAALYRRFRRVGQG